MILIRIRVLVMIIFLGILPYVGYSQCFCGKVRFYFKTPDLQIKNSLSNYSVKVLHNSLYRDIDMYEEWNIQKQSDDSSSPDFRFSTGSGIDSLTFLIRKLQTNDSMIVSVANLEYDTPYYIDLTNFTTGHFYFNMTSLMNCAINNKDSKIIHCEGKQFVLITSKENAIYPWSVKPLDIRSFKVKD